MCDICHTVVLGTKKRARLVLLACVTCSEVQVCRGGGGFDTWLSCQLGGSVVLLSRPRAVAKASVLVAQCMYVGGLSGLPPGGLLLVREGDPEQTDGEELVGVDECVTRGQLLVEV